MRRLLRRCVPALHGWTVLLGVGLAGVAFLAADRWLHLGVLAGAAPGLLVLACLLPCAIPVALVRRSPTPKGLRAR